MFSYSHIYQFASPNEYSKNSVKKCIQHLLSIWFTIKYQEIFFITISLSIYISVYFWSSCVFKQQIKITLTMKFSARKSWLIKEAIIESVNALLIFIFGIVRNRHRSTPNALIYAMATLHYSQFRITPPCIDLLNLIN